MNTPTQDERLHNGLCDCGHPPSEHSDFTTGYGIDEHGKSYCYACCAERDKKHMIEHGAIVLYLDMEKCQITNWPGSLRFTCSKPRVNHHNIAGTRYDTWFVGPDNHVWHAVQYDDSTQCATCKRTKEQKHVGPIN